MAFDDIAYLNYFIQVTLRLVGPGVAQRSLHRAENCDFEWSSALFREKWHASTPGKFAAFQLREITTASNGGQQTSELVAGRHQSVIGEVHESGSGS